MDFLVLFAGEDKKFDEEMVFQILANIPGVYDLKREPNVDAVIEGRCDFEDDSTIVRLSEDLETITISGTGKASLQLALEIQKALGTPLRVFDSDYSFDLMLNEINSLSDFEEKIASANSEDYE